MSTGSEYYDKMIQPVVLTEDDEQQVARLVRLRCRGCGEKVLDGCLPGCTDRD